MIKTVNAGTGLQVTNGYSNWPTFYNTGSSNTLIGQIRYNGSGQNFEVYDGSSWLLMSSAHPTVELSGDVQACLSWVKQKMMSESKIKALAAEYPHIASLHDNIVDLEGKLDMMMVLLSDKRD